MVDFSGEGEGETKPEKKGLFSKKTEETGPDISDILEQVNSVGRRLRLLESRYTDLNRRAQVTETNMLNERKRFITEIKTTNSDIIELKKELEGIKNNMDLVINELKNFASKDDFAVLKKYIEFWEPVNFVTRNEVEKIIEEKFQKSE
ncbi:hypothetical protein KY343_02730 [Candidatus Woesearchaeota archaeon]|nr:hypothetical protein [Candidatus Woesearchaeota archaeon]